MTAFRVDLGTLELLVERMGAVEAELTEIHEDVESRMGRLQVGWSGRAAAEHQAAFQRWSSGAAEAHAALVRLREITRISHGNYGAALAASRAMWAT